MRIALILFLAISGLGAVIFAYVTHANPLIFAAGMVATVGAMFWALVELAVGTTDAVVKAGIEALTDDPRRRR